MYLFSLCTMIKTEEQSIISHATVQFHVCPQYYTWLVASLPHAGLLRAWLTSDADSPLLHRCKRMVEKKPRLHEYTQADILLYMEPITISCPVKVYRKPGCLSTGNQSRGISLIACMHQEVIPIPKVSYAACTRSTKIALIQLTQIIGRSSLDYFYTSNR
jgi:hypothetical protein